MTTTKWQKVYVGPFKKAEAVAIAQDLRNVAKPDVNDIYDARVRSRRGKADQFDVFIKTTK